MQARRRSLKMSQSVTKWALTRLHRFRERGVQKVRPPRGQMAKHREGDILGGVVVHRRRAGRLGHLPTVRRAPSIGPLGA